MSFRLKYLRCYIIRRPTYGSPFLPRKANLGSQAKITHLDMHILIEEKISQFEIPMNDFLGMQILQGLQNLQHKVPDLILCEPPFPLDEVIQSLQFILTITLLVHISSTIYTLRLSSKLCLNFTML